MIRGEEEIIIIAAGSIYVDERDRAAFLDAAGPLIVETRLERGCHDYVLSADPLDTSRVRVFEIWESELHLEEHSRTAHVARFFGEVEGLRLVRASDAQAFEVSDVRPIRRERVDGSIERRAVGRETRRQDIPRRGEG